MQIKNGEIINVSSKDSIKQILTFYKDYLRSQKDVELLISPSFKIEQTLFVDDIPTRIKNLPDENMIVAPKFDSQSSEKDNYLLTLQDIIDFLINTDL